MTPGRIAGWLAVLAAVSVLGIFFFPVLQGPYSAVHGPVTALLSIRAASRMRVSIVRAGLNAIRGWFGRVGIALKMLSWGPLPLAECNLTSLPLELGTVLRC